MGLFLIYLRDWSNSSSNIDRQLIWFKSEDKNTNGNIVIIGETDIKFASL